MPRSELALDIGYLSKIPDHAQSQKVSSLHSFWEPIWACGLLTRTGSRPRKDHSDTKLGSAEECETNTCYSRTYGILQKVYQKLCLDHHANGKNVEEGCHILLE